MCRVKVDRGADVVYMHVNNRAWAEIDDSVPTVQLQVLCHTSTLGWRQLEPSEEQRLAMW